MSVVSNVCNNRGKQQVASMLIKDFDQQLEGQRHEARRTALSSSHQHKSFQRAAIKSLRGQFQLEKTHRNL